MGLRDERRIAASIAIEAWIRTLPCPATVRPARCPACQTASRPLGRSLNLVGHGLRPLLLYGLVELAGKPALFEVVARRYRCLPCGAVCVVVPSGVAAGRRYTGPTIALALTLWSLRRLSAARVRRVLSPFQIVGASAVGWASLRRWAQAYGLGEGTLRERAARFAQHLLATSSLPAQRYALEPRVFAASLSVARCPSC